MTKYILGGLLAFVLLCAGLAPPSLLKSPLARMGGLQLTYATGTLWNGVGDLRLGEVGPITVEWYFDWAGIPAGALAYRLRLYGENTHLHGRLAIGLERTKVAAEGGVEADAFNPWLAQYGLHLSGWLGLEEMTAAFADGGMESANGKILWGGGPVVYGLGGKKRSATLPPLLARVQSAPAEDAAGPPGIQAKVLTQDGERPLIEAEAIGGWVKIGVTKRLLRLSDVHWPGKEADDEVVITLEEQLL